MTKGVETLAKKEGIEKNQENPEFAIVFEGRLPLPQITNGPFIQTI